MKAIQYFSKNKRLRRLHKRVHGRLGDNLYLIMGIMAVLLVFCGLVIGLLGRGWAGAWFLVMLGLTIGFFPCLGILIGTGARDQKKEKEQERERIIRSDYMESPMARQRRKYQEEMSKKAIELEAMIAREQIKKRTEQRIKEEELLRQEERIRREFKERERQKLLDEQRRSYEKEKAEREKSEREKQKWKRAEYSQNVYHGNGTHKKKAPGIFAGVTNQAELKKKYKELMKQYHPDNGGSDPEMVQKIKKEYEELERFFVSYEKHSAKR